jgi:hypothetical protein
VHSDAFTKIRFAFNDDDSLVALFGSYDDSPRDRGVVSVFRNLLHHHVHSEGASPASTFWSGLGAIRRSAFENAGGFIEQPMEDVELGMFLARAGNLIRLDPQIQGTHLKAWTLRTMLWTDLMLRGAPWVALLLSYRRRGLNSALNLGWRHRFSAIASLVLISAALWRAAWIAAGGFLVLIALNWRFYRLLIRRAGLATAAAGLPLHVLHHIVSVLAIPLGVLSFLQSSHRTPETRR